MTEDNMQFDFSGFSVPTAETVPLGKPGSIIMLKLLVTANKNGGVEMALDRAVVNGIWTPLRGIFIPPKEPSVGTGRGTSYPFHRIVTVNYTAGWLVGHDDGFLLSGKALLQDEDKLASLLHTAAHTRLNRLSIKASPSI